ncbi:MAG: hypothetical protein Q8868_15250 [Bacteroidota bacterium]|nr:hypothetical protein [Bacteroidota bacterium]
MSAETLAIKAEGVLYTQFGSFSGSTEIHPSLCLITFCTTEAFRLNSSLLAYVVRDQFHMLKKYCGSSMTCKTEHPGTGVVTFYMFQVSRVMLSQANFAISSLQVIGRVVSKCTCFMN